MIEKSMMKKAELTGVLHYLKSPTPGWSPFCETCSALTGDGIKEAWEKLEGFYTKFMKSGYIEKRRLRQDTEWFKSLLEAEILRRFYLKDGVKGMIEHYKKLVSDSSITAAKAVKNLMESVDK